MLITCLDSENFVSSQYCVFNDYLIFSFCSVMVMGVVAETINKPKRLCQVFSFRKEKEIYVMSLKYKGSFGILLDLSCFCFLFLCLFHLSKKYLRTHKRMSLVLFYFCVHFHLSKNYLERHYVFFQIRLIVVCAFICVKISQGQN